MKITVVCMLKALHRVHRATYWDAGSGTVHEGIVSVKLRYAVLSSTRGFYVLPTDTSFELVIA